MKILRDRRGASLLEIIFVTAMVSTIAGTAAYLLSKNGSFIKRTGVRSQVLSESRACMDNLVQRLRNGKARTLVISTPPANAPFQPVPNSRVDFKFQTPLPSGANAYAIYLTSGTLYTQEFINGSALPPRPLASNVTGLSFAGDSRDPSILNISLRIEAPWDSSNDPTHVSTVILPNQVVHLSEAP